MAGEMLAIMSVDIRPIRIVLAYAAPIEAPQSDYFRVDLQTARVVPRGAQYFRDPEDTISQPEITGTHLQRWWPGETTRSRPILRGSVSPLIFMQCRAVCEQSRSLRWRQVTEMRRP